METRVQSPPKWLPAPPTTPTPPPCTPGPTPAGAPRATSWLSRHAGSQPPAEPSGPTADHGRGRAGPAPIPTPYPAEGPRGRTAGARARLPRSSHPSTQGSRSRGTPAPRGCPHKPHSPLAHHASHMARDCALLPRTRAPRAGLSCTRWTPSPPRVHGPQAPSGGPGAREWPRVGVLVHTTLGLTQVSVRPKASR